MIPYYQDNLIILYNGDCNVVLKDFEDNSIDSAVFDPPYGLEFMGKDWDRLGKPAGFRRKNNPKDVGCDSVGGRLSSKAPEYIAGVQMQEWHTAWASEVFRVLKPGAYLLAFGGSRTYHRLACAVEDAGFEIRDQIMWIYGSGFPKSHNLDGDLDGFGTALKPAHEPIVVARKPLIGTVKSNMEKYNVGALNIKDCRVASLTPKLIESGMSPLGRWPANVIHDGSDAVVACFPKTASGTGAVKRRSSANRDGNTGSAYGAESRKEGTIMTCYGDAGSASRFFYCAKASKAERGGTENKHPTVKPLALMQYLIRLVTPKNGTILDPFAGSGTTLLAARSRGFHCIGIEQHEPYCEISMNRLIDA